MITSLASPRPKLSILSISTVNSKGEISQSSDIPVISDVDNLFFFIKNNNKKIISFFFKLEDKVTSCTSHYEFN